jgi:hypothetical protein
VSGRGSARAAGDGCRVESRDGQAGARERKPDVECEGAVTWSGVARKVKEQGHMGGEWVKRPEGAKGCENFGVRLWGLEALVLVAGSDRRGLVQLCCKSGVSWEF